MWVNKAVVVSSNYRRINTRFSGSISSISRRSCVGIIRIRGSRCISCRIINNIRSSSNRSFGWSYSIRSSSRSISEMCDNFGCSVLTFWMKLNFKIFKIMNTYYLKDQHRLFFEKKKEIVASLFVMYDPAYTKYIFSKWNTPSPPK